MEKDLPGLMTPFDEMVSSPQLQLIKLLIPYAPPSGRRMLAAFVKFTELRETFHLFGQNGPALSAQSREDNSPRSPLEILDSFRPYLGPRECEMLDTVIQAREIMSMMDLMRNTSSGTDTGTDESSSGSSTPFDPMDLLSGMLTPDQQEMFHLYSALFSGQADSSEKGENTDERMDGSSGDEEYRSGETGTD